MAREKEYELHDTPGDPAYNAVEYRIRYGDTDLAGHMYYGRYGQVFEIGRTELLRAAGATYRDWERTHGVMLPVRECYLRYHAPAMYDDLVQVKTWLTEATAVIFRFDYRIECGGRLLTSGFTRHPVVDLETRRPVRRGLELLAPLGIRPYRGGV